MLICLVIKAFLKKIKLQSGFLLSFAAVELMLNLMFSLVGWLAFYNVSDGTWGFLHVTHFLYH